MGKKVKRKNKKGFDYKEICVPKVCRLAEKTPLLYRYPKKCYNTGSRFYHFTEGYMKFQRLTF